MWQQLSKSPDWSAKESCSGNCHNMHDGTQGMSLVVIPSMGTGLSYHLLSQLMMRSRPVMRRSSGQRRKERCDLYALNMFHETNDLQTYEPSPEDIEQNELIMKLTAKWRCNDRTCKRFTSFLDKTTAKHVHLTHFHLQTWAAAVVCSSQSVFVQIW